MTSKYQIYKWIEKIKKLTEKKLDFPEDLKFSKEFYDYVHQIGENNIMTSEKILQLVDKIRSGVEEISYDYDEVEIDMINDLCTRTRVLQENDIDCVLDALICFDKVIKSIQKSVKDKNNITKSEMIALTRAGVNLDIFDIDVI